MTGWGGAGVTSWGRGDDGMDAVGVVLRDTRFAGMTRWGRSGRGLSVTQGRGFRLSPQ